MIQYKYHPAPSLFCEKWCPQFKKTESKTHTTLLCKTCISLRWHYPNQVSGQDYQVYSQPIYLSSLFSHIISHLFCFVKYFFFCIFLYFCLCHLLDIFFFRRRYTNSRKIVYNTDNSGMKTSIPTIPIRFPPIVTAAKTHIEGRPTDSPTT